MSVFPQKVEYPFKCPIDMTVISTDPLQLVSILLTSKQMATDKYSKCFNPI